LDTDNSTFQPKGKLDTVLFPAKDLKEKSFHSIFGHDSDLIKINNSKEHPANKLKTSSFSPLEEPKECNTMNINNLPLEKSIENSDYY
jgi:activator of S phase kinase